MRKLKTIVLATTGALAVMGCAPLKQEPWAKLDVQPVLSVRSSADCEALYWAGRYFQGQGKYEQALKAYRQALAMAPNHADAHNALGVIYSLQGRTGLAEQEFRAALAIDPEAARVHNNLGYHLMINGRVEEALASFSRAGELEPQNAMVGANIAIAREKLGFPGDTTRPVSLEGPIVAQQDLPSNVSVPKVTMRLDQVAEGVWQLRDVPRSMPVVVRAERTASTAVAQDRIEIDPRAVVTRISDASGIEISNGNGTSGLAHQVSRLLAPRGIKKPRLTNAKPYGVTASRIQYVEGAGQAAREINLRLPIPLPLARVASLDRNTRVRVLLGKDFPRQVVATESGALAPLRLADARLFNEQ